MKKLLLVVFIILICLFSLISPINRTPLHESDFYKQMQATFDTIKLIPSPKGKLSVGWSSFGIIPDHVMPMAGYSPRDHFDSVHDSLYAKLLYLSNGYTTSYLITIDLLIFPPKLKEMIEARMKTSTEFIYLSASHTHSGLGGWNESLVGRYVAGNFDEKWLGGVADSIIINMDKAKRSATHARLSYWEADASDYVSNRLVDNGKTDGKLRGIQVVREDSTKALYFTYSAHPTNIDPRLKAISGDYPNATNKALEKHGYAFSMFMSGMVGSHRLDHIEGTDFQLTENAAEKLSGKILDASQHTLPDSVSIAKESIELPLGNSQLRITRNWKVRDWLFRAAFGKLKADITYFKVGDVLLLGTSCDFSGELAINHQLDKLATQQGMHLIITSFNGNYTGYITDDSHYDEVDREEVRVMNWIGPYYGQYYYEVIKTLIEK